MSPVPIKLLVPRALCLRLKITPNSPPDRLGGSPVSLTLWQRSGPREALLRFHRAEVARPTHGPTWTVAALRMSRSVKGELGFKASRSIRRLRATFLWVPEVQFKAA